VNLPELAPGDLVAIEHPASEPWLAWVQKCWEAQAVLLPIEPRLPSSAKERLLKFCNPSVINGERVHSNTLEPGLGLIIATSGTTGRPKAVRLSRQAITAAVTLSAQRLQLGNEPWNCPIPVAHIGGMLVVMRGVLLGVPVSFDAPGVSVGWASIVPMQLRRLVAQGDRLDDRWFLIGGDRLDSDLREQAENLGARIVHTYGMSETCGGVVYDGVPLDEVTVTIDDQSLIHIDSPTLFDGYMGGPDRQGPHQTNDIGTFDSQGHLIVQGRNDDIAIIAGEKLSRAALEAHLSSHPQIRVIQVGIEKHDLRGAKFFAVVDTSLDDEAIVEYVRSSLGALAVPRIQRVKG
jgi:o-succinylbenzoate---CoA ligase